MLTSQRKCENKKYEKKDTAFSCIKKNDVI